MVFVRIGAERRQNRGRHLAFISREERLIAKVIQRLIGVIAQEPFYVLGSAQGIVEVLGVGDLVLVQLVEHVEGVFLKLLLPRR